MKNEERRGVCLMMLITLYLCSTLVVAVSTVPPVPLTVQINEGSSSWTTVVQNEKEIDILQLKHPHATILKLYEQNALYKSWFTAEVSTSRSTLSSIPWTYHSNEQLINELNSIHSRFPLLSSVYSIGKSTNGVDMWVFSIAVNGTANGKMKPSVRWVTNIHGDETVGRELFIHLADELLSLYTAGTDERIVKLLNNVDIDLMPCANPDGYQIGWRNNKNNLDLNRNFPDQFRPDQGSSLQVETKVLMDWITSKRFTLSGNLHGGALVASYGYDGVPSGGDTSGIYSKAPDDDLFIYLSHVYAGNHKQMPYKLTNPEFGGPPDYGITNGAYWYSLYGGMQDFSYLHGKCPEVTFEISVVKNPPASTLHQFYNDNYESLIAFSEQAYKAAIGGRIFKSQSNQTLNGTLVTITVSSIDYQLTTTEGFYFRLLTPGNEYNVTASAPGFANSTVCNVVVTETSNRDTYLQIDFELQLATNPASNTQLACDSYYVRPEESFVESKGHMTTTTVAMQMLLLLSIFVILQIL